MCHKRARGHCSRSRSPALGGSSWAEADVYVTHAPADIVPVAVTRPGGGWFSEPWRNPQIAVFTASERLTHNGHWTCNLATPIAKHTLQLSCVHQPGSRPLRNLNRRHLACSIPDWTTDTSSKGAVRATSLFGYCRGRPLSLFVRRMDRRHIAELIPVFRRLNYVFKHGTCDAPSWLSPRSSLR